MPLPVSAYKPQTQHIVQKALLYGRIRAQSKRIPTQTLFLLLHLTKEKGHLGAGGILGVLFGKNNFFAVSKHDTSSTEMTV